MSVANSIIDAFNESTSCNSALKKEWTLISFRIGSLLPNSRLATTVQRDGDIDLMLRSMEDDFRIPKTTGPHALHAHYQEYFSELWVGSVYETLRLLLQRKLGLQTEEFCQLAEDFRLLRVALEKHEIPSDKKLKASLPLLRLPAHGSELDIYEYSKNDQSKSVIIPTGISANGSVMWNVIEIMADGSAKERWLERRALSDRIISAFRDHPEPST